MLKNPNPTKSYNQKHEEITMQNDAPTSYELAQDLARSNKTQRIIANYGTICVDAIHKASEGLGLSKIIDIKLENAVSYDEGIEKIDPKDSKILLNFTLSNLSSLERNIKEACREAGYPIDSYKRPEMPDALKAINTMPLITDIDPTRANAAGDSKVIKL